MVYIEGYADRFTVYWQDSELSISPSCVENSCNALVMLPASYEKSGEFPLKVLAGIDETTVTVRVKDKNYPKQELTVEPKYVALSKEDQERAANEREFTLKAIKTFSQKRMWKLPFVRPVSGDVSSEFGLERTFNGEPRSRHSGVDFRGATGTKILSVTDGIVILTGDYFFAGKFVFVDHGQGLVSAYMHMSEILAETGDKVKPGDVLGLVGATGRVTGPHLHFGLYTQGVSVDPMSFFN